jgi:hypothetical protein
VSENVDLVLPRRLVPFILRHLYFVDFDFRMHFFPNVTVCLGALAGICLGC